MLTTSRCAKKIVYQRFQPDVKQLKDVVGSFISNGATTEEVTNELMLQVYVATASPTMERFADRSKVSRELIPPPQHFE